MRIRGRKPEDFREEIEAHVQLAADEFRAEGLTPDEAQAAALRAFGNVTAVRERFYESRRMVWLDQLLQDLRFGVRTLLKSPGFTTVAILSLALGIGANTAIFSLVNTLMLRMLPVRDPQQLVELLVRYPGEPRGSYFSWQSYEHYRDYNHVFSELIGAESARFIVRGEGLESETVNGEYVIGDFFPALGVKAAIGRLMGTEDDHVGAPGSAVAVVSWSYWMNRFNQDPGILGKRIFVEDVPVTIVGVAPVEFFGLQMGSTPDVWIPVAMEPMIDHPSRMTSGRMGIKLMARLKPGVSIEQARAEMSVLHQWTVEERMSRSKDPLMRQLKSEVAPAAAGFSQLRDQFGKPLLLLMAVAGLLLLIACTNVASMLLARGATRQHEMALRVSLGAGKLRLVRQLLTESLLLSAAGGVLGVFLAHFGADALVRIIASGRQIPGLPPRIQIQVQPDVHVLLFTAGVAFLTGVLFGLAPVWNSLASVPASSLREIGKAVETKSRRHFGKSLVVGQVALSVVLLTAAGLLVSYLVNIEGADLGFRRDHVLLVTLDPARSGYDSERLSQAFQELLGRIESIPGVRSATLSAATPISGAGASRFASVEGYREKPEDRRYVSLNWVAPKYFETLGTPFLAGRDFNLEDRGRPRVAIINQTMARYYFRDSNPIGKHVTLDGDNLTYAIVGVVGDAKYYEIREAPLRTIYLDTFQFPGSSSRFAIRTNIDPAAVAPEVRRTVRERVKTIPVLRVTTLADQVDASIVPERLMATMSGWFGGLGTVLAAIGVYGLLAYTVARRTNQIGVRMALGATRSSVSRAVLGSALAMVCAGVVIGVPAVLWGERFAASLIQDLPVQTLRPLVFAVVVIIAIALLAAYIPARRAARVDPMEALRYE